MDEKYKKLLRRELDVLVDGMWELPLTEEEKRQRKDAHRMLMDILKEK